MYILRAEIKKREGESEGALKKALTKLKKNEDRLQKKSEGAIIEGG